MLTLETGVKTTRNGKDSKLGMSIRVAPDNPTWKSFQIDVFIDCRVLLLKRSCSDFDKVSTKFRQKVITPKVMRLRGA